MDWNFKYGTENDPRFTDDNPFSLTKADDPQTGSLISYVTGYGVRNTYATAKRFGC